MFLFHLLIFNTILLNFLISCELYDEKYRPQIHYSPPHGWMNDPNGLIFVQDTFHLFYQHWPNGTKWGPMHWGHAVSKDLIYWQTLPIALYPQGKDYIFSGSAIIDQNNVTGLQPKSSPTKTMIAIFTAHTIGQSIEQQGMAYSNDNGLDWKFFQHNPIIANPNPKTYKDFRDPNVFKYEDHFVLTLVVYNHIEIYNSYDLKNWTLVSQFGQTDGSHQGVWECPDLFPMNVTINGKLTEKWVLLISTGNTTGISTGPNMEYYIGSFDGKTFINDNPNDIVLWIDYGPDSYAGVTYNLTPDRKRVFINWMNRWDYAESLPLTVWNGQMGLPRILSLTNNSDNRLLLSTLPVPEIDELRSGYLKTIDVSLKSNQLFEIEIPNESQNNILDIELTVNISRFRTGDSFGVEFKGIKDKLRVYFNGSFVINRTDTGRHDFSKNYGLVYKAPRLTNSPIMDLRLILDISSIELFGDNGLTSMTSLFFSDDNLGSNVRLFYKSIDKNNDLNVIKLNAYHMKSIWKY